MAKFLCHFFGGCFSRISPPPPKKIHAQNSRPELSAFLSNFTFSNPKFIEGDFLLIREMIFAGKSAQKIHQENPLQNPPQTYEQISAQRGRATYVGCTRRGSHSAKGRGFLPSKHLLSTFYKTLPSKNPSKNLVFTENPYRRLLRTLLRSTYC